MEDRRQFGMKLSVDLIARVDKARGPMSRTRYVESALEAALEDGETTPVPGPEFDATMEALGAEVAKDPKPRRQTAGVIRSHVSQLPTMAEMKAKRAEDRRNR